jgi:hypothetical protein
MAFEITAMLFRANFAWIVSNNAVVLDQARAGIENTLAHAAPKSRRQKRRRSRKKKTVRA